MAEKVSKTVLELQKIRRVIGELRTDMSALMADVRGLTAAVRDLLTMVKDHDERLTRLEGRVQ